MCRGTIAIPEEAPDATQPPTKAIDAERGPTKAIDSESDLPGETSTNCSESPSSSSSEKGRCLTAEFAHVEQWGAQVTGRWADDEEEELFPLQQCQQPQVESQCSFAEFVPQQQWEPQLQDHAVRACSRAPQCPEFVPQQRQVALPVRALQSRMQSSSTVPTWAAWLPRGIQQGQCTSAPQSVVSTSQAVTFDGLPILMPANANYISDDGCFGVADQSTQFVGMDGVIYQAVYQPVYAWPEEGGADACTYYTGAQQEQGYAQWEQPAQQGHLSLGALTGNVWELSKDGHSCRLVQDAFDNAINDEERMALTSELKGHVWEAIKCQNANHVMQKCISVIRPLAAQFVIDELTDRGPGGAAQAARHRFGCRIIERLLEHCSLEQVSPLVEALLADVAALSSHIYGNYVVQHLLEHCGPDVALRISSVLEQHVFTMPADGYAGTVIGKALSHASRESSRTLALSVLKDPERVAVMACSRWGHHAVKQALHLADEPERIKACAELSWRSNRLRSSRYGRLVSSFAAEQQKLLPSTCTN